MKQVCHIITELEIGGAEKQLALLLPYMQDTAQHNVICLIGQGSMGTLLEKSGITVRYLHGKSQFDIRIPLRLYVALKRTKPDIIVTYLIFADIISRLIARLAGVNTLVSSQRSSLVGRSWLRKFDRITSRFVTRYHVQTEIMKKQLIHELRVPDQKFTVIPNAANIPNYAAHRNFESSPLTITCVGNLKPGKGHENLLQAITDPLLHDLEFQILLVGDGPLRENLLRKTNELNLQQRVSFLGLRDDIPKILQKTEIFILPTEGEGMSNALLEAMAHGIACITTNIPANQAIIDHEITGILVPAGQPSALANAIHRLVTHNDLRENLGTAARHYIEKNHRVEKIASQWNDLLLEI